MLQGFLCCDPLFRVRLETPADEIYELGVFLDPVLFEIGDSFSYLRQIQVFNLLWFISNCHFIEDNAIGPHVYSW